ncbi:MAG TPA: hypothetical protein VKK31_11700 [Thermoanaerobaculia bacterium]|nr:hypothetical protein [Thermoanaerobaculia bacterium]
MTQTETETQEALRGVVEELKGIHARLQELARALPDSKGQDDVEEEPDIATEVRSIIGCVLLDQIGPAVRDLDAAAGYRPKGRRGGWAERSRR